MIQDELKLHVKVLLTVEQDWLIVSANVISFCHSIPIIINVLSDKNELGLEYRLGNCSDNSINKKRTCKIR